MRSKVVSWFAPGYKRARLHGNVVVVRRHSGPLENVARDLDGSLIERNDLPRQRVTTSNEQLASERDVFQPQPFYFL